MRSARFCQPFSARKCMAGAHCTRRFVMAATTTSGELAITHTLQEVLRRVDEACKRVQRPIPPRLVAVSKTKPVELINEAYAAGHRIFGENYVQEMLEKAPQLPHDIQWHFIGHLQSNKVKAVIEKVPNLSMVETVDDPKLADKLSKAVAASGRPPLSVMVQVNTSGEESKYGVEPGECVDLARHIADNCPNLRLVGLMTIGQPDYSSRPENFVCLAECRKAVADALGMQPEQLELSMGMSGDFEQAIEMGSTNIRVGSTIFGAREYPTTQ